MKTVHVRTQDLPRCVQDALRAMDYGAKDVPVTLQEKVSPVVGGGTGMKGFFMLVDLNTGKREIHEGSWGGANPFNDHNAVDLDETEYTLPSHGIAIKGTTGYPRTFATIYAHPSQAQGFLPQPAEDVTPLQQCIINAYCSLTSAGRKDAFADWARGSIDPCLRPLQLAEGYGYMDRITVSPGELHTATESLIAKGLLSRNKAGSISITTAGKNARTR